MNTHLNRQKILTHCTQRITPSLPPMNTLFNSELGWNATDKAATFWLAILLERFSDFTYNNFSPDSSPYLQWVKVKNQINSDMTHTTFLHAPNLNIRTVPSSQLVARSESYGQQAMLHTAPPYDSWMFWMQSCFKSTCIAVKLEIFYSDADFYMYFSILQKWILVAMLRKGGCFHHFCHDVLPSTSIATAMMNPHHRLFW